MTASQLTDEELSALLQLRTARVRHAAAPALPLALALRLHEFGLLRPASIPRPGQQLNPSDAEITDKGLAELESRYLFCRAPGCDGVLHSQNRAVAGPLTEQPDEMEREEYPVRCPKCGSPNLVTARETAHGVELTVKGVIAPR